MSASSESLPFTFSCLSRFPSGFSRSPFPRVRALKLLLLGTAMWVGGEPAVARAEGNLELEPVQVMAKGPAPLSIQERSIQAGLKFIITGSLLTAGLSTGPIELSIPVAFAVGAGGGAMSATEMFFAPETFQWRTHGGVLGTGRRLSNHRVTDTVQLIAKEYGVGLLYLLGMRAFLMAAGVEGPLLSWGLLGSAGYAWLSDGTWYSAVAAAEKRGVISHRRGVGWLMPIGGLGIFAAYLVDTGHPAGHVASLIMAGGGLTAWAIYCGDSGCRIAESAMARTKRAFAKTHERLMKARDGVVKSVTTSCRAMLRALSPSRR